MITEKVHTNFIMWAGSWLSVGLDTTQTHLHITHTPHNTPHHTHSTYVHHTRTTHTTHTHTHTHTTHTQHTHTLTHTHTHTSFLKALKLFSNIAI